MGPVVRAATDRRRSAREDRQLRYQLLSFFVNRHNKADRLETGRGLRRRVFMGSGSHAVDYISSLRKIQDCRGNAADRSSSAPELTASTNRRGRSVLPLWNECGAKGTITASKKAGTNDDLNFTIYGTKGTVKFDLMDPSWLWFCDGEMPSGELGGERGFTRIECVGRYPSPGDKFPGAKAVPGWIRSHVESYHDFLTSILKDRPTCPDISDAAEVTRIVESAYMSAETGRRISL